MATKGKLWYVLKAVSGKEAKVKEYIEAELKHNDFLAKHVAQVLIPTEKYASQRDGKRVIKEKLSLPGYVLVEAEMVGDVAHTLRSVPNVLGFLGGMNNPSPVRQSGSVQWFLRYHRRGECREAQTESDGQDIRQEDSSRIRFYASGKRIGHCYGCAVLFIHQHL